jgi:hypothetical protein
LQPIEKEIIGAYGINRLAFAPSIYGDTKVRLHSIICFFPHLLVERWWPFQDSVV